jgi:1-acyl-sn-glycerol-3-phosphate acyltransferase
MALAVAVCRCIQFDRKSIKDRSLVAQRLRQHVADATANPLLIFPEGT